MPVISSPHGLINAFVTYSACVAGSTVSLLRNGAQSKWITPFLRAGVIFSLPFFLIFALMTMLFTRAWDPPEEE